MLNTNTLLYHFGSDFPKWIAADWGDYVGLMVGPLPRVLNRVLITLDLEYLHQDELLALKPDLILTHHPFIYGSHATILKKDERKKAYVTWLKAHNIAVYSLHTNFDQGRGGMNDSLARQLGLHNIHPLERDPMARGGRLDSPMTMDAFARFVKQTFHVDAGWYIAEGSPMIKRVAIVGGGGSRSYVHAQAEGYDVFLSGDAPHHVRRSIVNDHFNYIELPHEIEQIFLPVMRDYVLALDPTLVVLTPFHQTFPRMLP